MSFTFGIGAVAGVLSVMVVVLIMKKTKNKKCEYDERQIAARRTAFKAGFITFVLCELTVFLTEIAIEEPLVIIVPGRGIVLLLLSIIILISALVFVEVSIFSDAYFTPNNPCSKKWVITMIIIGIIAIIQFIRQDEAWYKYMNLSCGSFILLIMASVGIKALISKRTSKSEEDESDDE